MVKFSHSIFALPFALMAAFLASRAAYRCGDAARPYPGAFQIILIIWCMVSARSAAMTFNRLVDAGIDARNPRTASRALAAGTMKRSEAIIFFLADTLAFLLGCAGFWLIESNVWPSALALPVLAYICFYSYTKRFTRWSHFVLGSAIALSPGAAWIAIHPPSLGWATAVLVIAVAFWIGGFDIIYACQDIESDQREGLHSLPSRIGTAQALWIARGCHLACVLLLLALMPLAGLTGLYAAGVGLVAILLFIENSLVRANDLSRINLAFFTVNGVISVLLAALTLADLLMHP